MRLWLIPQPQSPAPQQVLLQKRLPVKLVTCYQVRLILPIQPPVLRLVKPVKLPIRPVKLQILLVRRRTIWQAQIQIIQPPVPLSQQHRVIINKHKRMLMQPLVPLRRRKVRQPMRNPLQVCMTTRMQVQQQVLQVQRQPLPQVRL
jgi:hypothetical protein